MTNNDATSATNAGTTANTAAATTNAGHSAPLSPTGANVKNQEVTYNIAGIDSPLPAKFLSDDLKFAVDRCQEFKEQVEAFKMYPLHLTIGLVPSGMTLSVFRQIREAFLGSQFKGLGTTKEIFILDCTSKVFDIKNLMRALGVEEQKISIIPDALTCYQFKAGKLGPYIDQTDLANMSKEYERALYHFCCIFQPLERVILPGLKKTTGQSFRNWTLFLITLNSLPSDILLYEENKYQEYRIPCINYETAILGGIGKDIIDRYITQRQSRMIMSPMVHLKNCSGTGKTRAALQMSSITNVLYCKLWGSDGFSSSVVWKCIKNYFNAAETQHYLLSHVKMFVALQRIIYMCSKCYPICELTGNNDYMLVDDAVGRFFGMIPLTDEQEPIVKEKLFAGLESLSCLGSVNIESFEKDRKESLMDDIQIPLWNDMSLQQLIEHNSVWLFARREVIVALRRDLNQETLMKLPALLIVLDDIHDLMDINGNTSAVVRLYRSSGRYDSDVYSVLKGALRSLSFFWKSTLTVTISALADSRETNKPPELGPSYRPGLYVKFHEPIVLRHTF